MRAVYSGRSGLPWAFRTRQRGWLLRSLLLASLATSFAFDAGAAATLKNDEDVVVYPSIAWRSGSAWEGEIVGMVYETESRRLTLPVLKRALGFHDLSAEEEARFRSRATLFLVDHEHGKRFTLRLGSKEFTSNSSGQDGRFRFNWKLSLEEAEALSRAGRLEGAVTGGSRQFAAMVELWEPEGLTVISDIDDTIKVSHVRNRDALLKATFVDTYQAVPGMAAAYQRWGAEPGARFVYVSGSPWPLYADLSRFVRREGFPHGTVLLRDFRFKDGTAFKLAQSPSVHKRQSILPILERFPLRKFVLVGDSGEEDLEIYAGLAASHPEQVRHVFIRELEEALVAPPRREAAERQMGPVKLTVFRNPEESLALAETNR